MASITMIFFLFISVFLQKPATAQTCPKFCQFDGQEVKFPFGLNPDGKLNGRCSYPGFGLSCRYETGQLLLNLPKSGEFIIEFIDYGAQQIYINDPDLCLPKLFLEFNISESPFVESESWPTFTIFNCSATDVANAGIWYFSCLSSDQNYSVVISRTVSSTNSTTNGLPSSCKHMKTVRVPFGWINGQLGALRLDWSNPDCRSCVERQGDCRFRNRTGLEIGCFNLPSQGGIPRSAKYGIIIGIGIPGLLCLIGLISFIGSRVRRQSRRQNLPNFEFSTSISPSPAVIIRGLDGPTIESYPKTKLGDSGRLPKPNDNTCHICLSEYQPKETLRTIPECKHYFHAHCIDEWLKMNASCPLCRNSPSESSTITPSLLSSSSSSLSSPLSP